MPGRRWRIVAELLLVLVIMSVAASVFTRAPAKQAGDEANWLGTARFFLVLFVRHDISAESWPDTYPGSPLPDEPFRRDHRIVRRTGRIHPSVRWLRRPECCSGL